MSALEVRVDPDLCIGTGECVRIAPSAFRIDPSRGVSTVLPGAIDVGRDVLAEAAFNCPTRAIEISGDEE